MCNIEIVFLKHLQKFGAFLDLSSSCVVYASQQRVMLFSRLSVFVQVRRIERSEQTQGKGILPDAAAL